MVSEEHASDPAETESVRAIFPLRLGVGYDDDGAVYATSAPVDVVRIERIGVTDRSIVIDGNGVYLRQGERGRALHYWTDEVKWL